METISKKVLQALLITKNEDVNIGRVLDKLTWLEKVVIIDSYSTDNTIDIIKSYPNVEIVYRKFDTFAGQCNYGLSLLDSNWVLSLDADYVLTDNFTAETIANINNPGAAVAFYTKFEFLIFGRQLLSNNTTPRAVLFKKGSGSYFDDGHAHRLQIDGETGNYKARILHDDRKSLSRWLSSQDGYSLRESEKLMDVNNSSRKSLLNKIRRTKILSPFFVFFYCLFVRGLIFSGWAGWYYTLQRTMVEMLFSLRMIEDENLKIPEVEK